MPIQVRREALPAVGSPLMQLLGSARVAQRWLISAETNLLNVDVPRGGCTFPGYLFVTYEESQFECTG